MNCKFQFKKRVVEQIPEARPATWSFEVPFVTLFAILTLFVNNTAVLWLKYAGLRFRRKRKEQKKVEIYLIKLLSKFTV